MAPLPRTLIARVATGVAVTTVALVVVLWWAGTRGLEDSELVAARFDALRTGLSIGLGAGGLFALYLAWRRQHSTEIGLAQKQQDQADVARAYDLQERTAHANEVDAAARRITDHYNKSVEQLGSEKAPVRLGGLYALERLAHDHVEQRQTVVNMLCAYLRMPYTLPGAPPDDDELANTHRERVQEREVRFTSQRILTRHLRPGDGEGVRLDTYWSAIDLDLTGATLIDLDLSACKFRTGTFNGATLTGHTKFNDAQFNGVARFDRARFTDDADFNDVHFTDVAVFSDVKFAGQASFNRSQFDGIAAFDAAHFTGIAGFGGAHFTGETGFIAAHFDGLAGFGESKFAKIVRFGGAQFGIAAFGKARFAGTADFEGVRFASIVDFEDAQFNQGIPESLYQHVSSP